MSSRHNRSCCQLNPDLGIRDTYNSTWMICRIQKEFSSYLSLCIFNEYENDKVGAYHVEGKFLDFWENEPKKIFPDLTTNDIDRNAFDLIWYMPRSPCYECTKLIIKNRNLFKSLTILTASVYQLSEEDENFAPRRIEMLRDKEIMVEPMSPEEYEYFTQGRTGHQLPAKDNIDPEGDFEDHELPTASRDENFMFLPMADIRKNWQETYSRGSRGRNAESASWVGKRRMIPKKSERSRGTSRDNSGYRGTGRYNSGYRGTGRYNSGYRGRNRYRPY